MWSDNVLTLYHGCDENSADSIVAPTDGTPNGISLSHCSSATDFGRGFYTTTFLHQAQQWANLKLASLPRTRAAVVRFTVARPLIGGLANMAFVRDSTPPPSDYWDLVAHCRSGNAHDKDGVSGRFYVSSTAPFP